MSYDSHPDGPDETRSTAKTSVTTSLLLSSDAPEAAKSARVVVRALCAHAPPPPLSSDHVNTAVLLTSELVVNAVENTRSASLLDVALRDRTLRVSVTDHSPRLPVEPQRREDGVPSYDISADAPMGRGLAFVDALSDRWGYRPSRSSRSGQNGKTVWFELDVA